MRVALWKIAHARSGDKADRADIGLFAWDAPTYDVLKREVTVARVKEHFKAMCEGPVELWPLDNRARAARPDKAGDRSQSTKIWNQRAAIYSIYEYIE
jgi:hypothetical protein